MTLACPVIQWNATSRFKKGAAVNYSEQRYPPAPTPEPTPTPTGIEPTQNAPTSSTVQEAKALIARIRADLGPQGFGAPGKSVVASKLAFSGVLSAGVYLNLLEKRVEEPWWLDQKKSYFCWLAALCYYTYSVNPCELVRAMWALYSTGVFVFRNDIIIKPSTDMLNAFDHYKSPKFIKVSPNYTRISKNSYVSNIVDHLLLMTIADADRFRGLLQRHWVQILMPKIKLSSSKYNPGNENTKEWAGRTFEGVAGIWPAFGFDIESIGRSVLFSEARRKEVFDAAKSVLDENLTKSDSEKRDVVLFVDSNALLHKDKPRSVGRHFIHVHSLTDLGNNNYEMSYWDYGSWEITTFRQDLLETTTFGALFVNRNNGMGLRIPKP